MAPKKKTTKKKKITTKKKKAVDPHCNKKNVSVLWKTNDRYFVRDKKHCTRRVSKDCAETLKSKNQACLQTKPKSKGKCTK